MLPEPGDEQIWLDGLPVEDRAHMQGVGKLARLGGKEGDNPEAVVDNRDNSTKRALR